MVKKKLSLSKDGANKPNKNKIKDKDYFLISKPIYILIIIIFLICFITMFNFNIGTFMNHDDVSEVVSTNSAKSFLRDNDYIEGNKNASVLIIEWSDFECPLCNRFYSDTYGKIKKNYIDTGKVKFVFKSYPLSYHKNAKLAAEFSECAGMQGKFYEMHNLLFDKGLAGNSDILDYANELSLDFVKFKKCIDEGRMLPEIKRDMDEGIEAGLKGTPFFLVNGRVIKGTIPYSDFEKIIKKELKKVDK